MSSFKLDVGKLTTALNSETATKPRDIFTSLPSKNTIFQYPRDVQAQVWEKWYTLKDNQTNIIKMNTGSGKTSVGLIILKSCLNDGIGPAVYIVPDRYLEDQVIEEASKLGIAVTKDENSPKFRAGKEILIANIYKIVNGRSVFGVGDEGQKIPIGSVIVDDAHACLSTIEEQFTVSISNKNPAYPNLYRLFESSMITQFSAKTMEIREGDKNAYVRVPFWKWQEKINEITEILLKNKESDDLKFKWPLIKEHLSLSQCVVSSGNIEISPHCIPIQMIPSISNAKRRIFMTATLVDESILASHFGVTDDSLNNTITPNTIGDIGDRMILMPQVINPDLSDTDIKEMCFQISKSYNVVVIVPSDRRSLFWADVANVVLNKGNINEGVKRLRNEHVGLVVLVNRYDGIDLPNSACRLLVIDSLPDVRRLVDKVNQSKLLGSDKTDDEIIQKIEQGMGRGVRSSDDYCGVLLLGKALNGAFFKGSSLEKFSPATKAQIELSLQVVSQFSETDINTIVSALRYCLNQDTGWVGASRSVLTGLTESKEKNIDKNIINKRLAYDLASRNMSVDAADLLRRNASSPDKIYQGYLKEQASEYINLYDPTAAQEMLISASNDNYRVLKPIAGVRYLKLEGAALEQAKECSIYLKSNFKNTNEIIVSLNSLLDKIIFLEDTANIFEDSINRLAKYIGFKSHRPENDTGKGPDNLWLLGDNKYLVIECKNGATSDKICKSDCGQLNTSGHWFRENYDQTSFFVPVMIHQSTTLEYSATLESSTRIVNEEMLRKLKTEVHKFVNSLCKNDNLDDIQFIRSRLIGHKLRADDIIVNYTKKFRN